MTKTISVSINNMHDPSTLGAIRRILQAIDSEFMPPISSRQSTTAMQLNINKPGSPDGLDAYFDELIRQAVVLAMVDEEIAGFLSFKYQYAIECLPEYAPCNYITTIGV